MVCLIGAVVTLELLQALATAMKEKAVHATAKHVVGLKKECCESILVGPRPLRAASEGVSGRAHSMDRLRVCAAQRVQSEVFRRIQKLGFVDSFIVYPHVLRAELA